MGACICTSLQGCEGAYLENRLRFLFFIIFFYFFFIFENPGGGAAATFAYLEYAPAGAQLGNLLSEVCAVKMFYLTEAGDKCWAFFPAINFFCHNLQLKKTYYNSFFPTY